jgi:hypothetical protein
MDDLSLIKSELAKLRYADLPQLQAECGVPIGTMAKIKCGDTENPQWKTVKALSNYFRAKRSREQEAAAS